MENPQKQTNEEIINMLLNNEDRKYTEAAHAEIFVRLMESIRKFDQSSRAGGQRMFLLTIVIVSLTILNVTLAVFNFLTR
ncbi:MAG: hypothetical protein M1150_01080 [Patescibacteria group bacterium]|nr:hypothetical protein [Patescibacteria group bacterium]